ncbi:MAG: chromate transporter [Bacillota bacterium]
MIFIQLFRLFFFIGLFSFGGGYAMLPLIEQEVLLRNWMTTEEFTDMITLSSMLPGSVGINAATFIGYQTGGVYGALVATFGMILPSLLLVLLLDHFLIRFQQSQAIIDAFYGLRPVIIGLIFYSAIRFTTSMQVLTIINWESVCFVLIFLSTFLLLITKKMHPIMIIFLSGICGAVFFR